ncbi:energy-coupling factor ABC transporter ATP-binding protein [Microbacterium sp. NPDC056052]|uniref:energy-coupling factor ABC transporter ATP-binding protein n=1 Tax=Microbacterium sp. NPDC056052 TaxID=3345695 RepID=UPI0035D99081
MSPDIELRAVSLRLDGRTVLEDVSVRLTARRTAVIGANGSGKSSLVRLLNGLHVATTGTVSVDGLDPARDVREVRRRVGFVFADPEAQILMPTPAEDLALSLRGLPAGERAARVDEALALCGLGAFRDAPASDLSGGQKQLLALASVLIGRPRLVVADEPTTRLDLRNSRRIGDVLLDELEVPLVLVTHDLELARRCDEAVLVEEGRVLAQGAPDDVIAAYLQTCV